MEVPITQSREWENLQQALGEMSFYREEKQFRYLAIKKSTPLGAYLYLPFGPVAETNASFKAALKDIKELVVTEEAFFIRIEPQNPDYVKDFPKNTQKSHDLNPKETWVLDLNGTDEEYKMRLPSRLLRYYRNREKNGLKIETSKNPDDIKYLLKLQKALAKEKNISTFSENYLKTELAQPFATLYLVKYRNPETKNEELVAAGLVFDHGKTRYNLQGAQSEQGRKLHATGILTIQLIEDARAKGLKFFDFWGIAPEGAPDTHPWAGFTNFKKTFKGYEVDYAGTHDIVLNPVKYKLYQLLRCIRRKTRL
ncbi:MAG: peptidoglycan bridge formation glycyltransferase FemA/FemB family protein [Candidatus Saccharibacteria bacterium]|nr:peptidoglycan bridge formation glycyltransferase FemA/FemB family protein [Candidatus Saccharibacteria bacterium]